MLYIKDERLEMVTRLLIVAIISLTSMCLLFTYISKQVHDGHGCFFVLGVSSTNCIEAKCRYDGAFRRKSITAVSQLS